MIISNQASENERETPMLLQLNNNPFRSEKSRPILGSHQVVSGGSAYEYAPSSYKASDNNFGRRSLQLNHSQS
jgi:hypothetical protein